MCRKGWFKLHTGESITVRGKELVQVIKDLIKRGDVGKVCIVYEKRRLLEIPLMVGDPSAPAEIIKGPLLAALNAFGTLANECTLELEHADKPRVEKAGS